MYSSTPYLVIGSTRFVLELQFYSLARLHADKLWHLRFFRGSGECRPARTTAEALATRSLHSRRQTRRSRILQQQEASYIRVSFMMRKTPVSTSLSYISRCTVRLVRRTRWDTTVHLPFLDVWQWSFLLVEVLVLN